MKKTKLITIFIACALAAVFLFGCSAGQNVATVNGVPITLTQYNSVMDGALGEYGMTQDTMVETMGEEQAAQYKTDVLDSLVSRELLMQKAKELGLDQLTDDEKTQVEESADDYLAYVMEQMTAQAQEEAAQDATVDVDGRAKKLYTDYLASSGTTRDSMVEQYTEQTIITKVYNSVIDEYKMTDEDAKTYYDTNVEQQQKADQEDPAAALSSYLNNENAINLYVPSQASENVKYVKHILVSIPSEKMDEISALEADGKADEAEKMRQEELAKILPKADEVQKKAATGEDFDKLIEEYGEDPGMEYYPEGYMVHENAGFVESFQQASMSLKKAGDITPEPVESEYGYHIIKLVSVPEAGAIPFEDVKDQILETVGPERQAEYWESQLDEWTEEADIVKTPPEA